MPRMLLFLIVVSLTCLNGSLAQSRSAEQKARAGVHDEVPLIGIESLSDTQGVDFRPYFAELNKTIQAGWKKSFPGTIGRSWTGVVSIRFKILPNGQMIDQSMRLEKPSGRVTLDRAAWSVVLYPNGDLSNGKYPPLPKGFHAPFLEIRAIFSNNPSPEK